MALGFYVNLVDRRQKTNTTNTIMTVGLLAAK